MISKYWLNMKVLISSTWYQAFLDLWEKKFIFFYLANLFLFLRWTWVFNVSGQTNFGVSINIL